jgi:hypothetical protein
MAKFAIATWKDDNNLLLEVKEAPTAHEAVVAFIAGNFDEDDLNEFDVDDYSDVDALCSDFEDDVAPIQYMPV